MKDCSTSNDCRAGYICADLRTPPWNAILLDDNQDQHVCVPGNQSAFDETGNLPDADLPICQADPDIDAAFPAPPVSTSEDAGAPPVDAGADSGSDAGKPGDSGVDATVGDAGVDATAGDAGADASEDASADAALD